MTVTPDQIAKAKAKGLINVEALAAACDKYAFPFYLACVILAKETSGRNIFGHDHGGAFSDPDGKNIEVTEERYKEFLKLIGAGKTSNGVGPMQLTYKGYHIGPQSLTTLGYKAWLPADNIRYGVGRILKPSLAANLAKGQTLTQAFWNTAKAYNGNASYADDAQARAKVWKAAVGTADMEPPPPPVKPPEEDMAITDAEFARIQSIFLSVLRSEAGKRAIAEATWTTDDIIPAGVTETDSKNTAWKAGTFLRLIDEIRADLSKGK
jgi:hypothetical protein